MRRLARAVPADEADESPCRTSNETSLRAQTERFVGDGFLRSQLKLERLSRKLVARPAVAAPEPVELRDLFHSDRGFGARHQTTSANRPSTRWK